MPFGCRIIERFDTFTYGDYGALSTGILDEFVNPAFQVESVPKDDVRFRNRNRISRYRFIRVRVGTGLDHYLNLHQLLANLLHEMFLGSNADKYG